MSRRDFQVKHVLDGADITSVQQLASRLWPLSWHPGGLGWAMARGQLAEEVVLFLDDGAAAGWAARGMDMPNYMLALADPAVPPVADAIADWFKDVVAEDEFSIEVAATDDLMLAALRRAGYAPQRRAAVAGMHRSAVDVVVEVPEGYLVREVHPGEREARVEVHRSAWRPASLPYEDGRAQSADPEATSSFNADAYEAVCGTWLYDEQFDIVAVAPDGTLAGCCIAWYDQFTGIAEIEPLGVVPEHRGRGVAGALCLEVGARVRAAGGQGVFINTGPRQEYPAPARAYAKAGFEVFERAWTISLQAEA